MVGKLQFLTGVVLAAGIGGVALAQQGFGDPKMSEANLKQVAPHTWVIMGFPNVGVVVGDKAVLVVDTGLGNANGRAVAEVNGQRKELGPGDCCFFPPDALHVFTVVSDEPAQILVIYSPPYEESPERVVRPA